MALVFNTRTYNLDRSAADSNTFAGPNHTFSTADKVEMKRVYPKPTPVFAGVARPTLKITKSLVIDQVTGKRADAIVTLSGSLPVGAASADIDALMADVAALAALTDVKDLFKKLDIQA